MVLVVKNPAGLGKTTIAAEETAEYRGYVEVYVPTHKLAGEWEALILKSNPSKRVQVIHGRGQESKDGGFYCKKHELAEDLAKAGCSVFPNLCHQIRGSGQPPVRCEHYDTCQYIQQFGYAEVRIYVHAYLGRERSMLEPNTPSLVIIDESFWKDCIQTLTFPVDLLHHPELPDVAKALCCQLADSLQNKPEEVARIIRAAEENDTVNLAIRALGKVGARVSPGMNPREIRKCLKAMPAFHKVGLMLKQLRVESHLDRPVQSVTLTSEGREVTVHRRLAITRFSARGLRRVLGPTAKILILDASADRRIIERFLEVKRFEEISVERNAHVRQCYSTACPTTRLVPGRNSDDQSRADAERNIADIQKLVDRLAEKHRKALIIGPSPITGNERTGTKPLLNRPVNVSFEHFGAIRGLDKYKDFDAVMIIGRNQPPVEAIENYGRALYYDDPEPLQFSGNLTREIRGHSLHDGEYGVWVSVHPDHRLQAIMEQLRERESEQGLDRLRLIHHKGQPKEVLLLSNLPLDIDVDELRSTREIVQGGSRIERALARQDDGVLPLRPDWLAENCPDLWPTEAAAKKDVARKKGQIPNMNTISEMSLFEYEYKTMRQRRWSRCLSRSPSPEIVAEKLSTKLGEAVVARCG